MKVDLAQFCKDFDVAVVVLSRDRAGTLAKYTDTLLSGYTLFYSGEGYDEYQYRCADRIEVPRGLQGLSVVRNFVLDTLPHKVVVFFDDDVKSLYWIAGRRSIRLDEERVKLCVLDMVVHALDQKSVAFGLTPNDIRKSSPLAPFILRGVAACIIGVVGRDVRFDERNILKTDYDFMLMAMVHSRIVHVDRRYYFTAGIETVAGGNTTFRTQERRLREIANLIDWWGDDVIRPGTRKGTESLAVSVP